MIALILQVIYRATCRCSPNPSHTNSVTFPVDKIAKWLLDFCLEQSRKRKLRARN